MKMILNILGCLDQDDTAFITEPQTLGYVEKLQNSNLSKLKLDQEFDQTNKSIIEIVQSLLEFNPGFRGSLDKLIANPIFD